MFLQYLDSAAQQADERATEVTAAPWPVSWTAPSTLINVLVAVDGDAGPASEDAATWAAYDAYLTRSPTLSRASLRPLLAHTPCGRAHHGGGTAATPLLKLQWTLASSTPTGARYDAVLAQLDRCTCVCKSSVCSGPRVTTAPLTFHLLPSALPPFAHLCAAGLESGSSSDALILHWVRAAVHAQAGNTFAALADYAAIADRCVAGRGAACEAFLC